MEGNMSGDKRSEKKRRNAFSDYEVSQEELATNPHRSSQPLEKPELESEVVQQIYPSQLRPDPFQPRPSPLPTHILSLFNSGKIDVYEAARMWLDFVRDNPDGYGSRIDSYLNMGKSIEEDGQVNPITVVWDAENNFFWIETGEQRFWSTVLQSVATKQTEEPVLRAIIKDQISIERQVVENLLKFEPTAVTHAREVAKLILRELDREPSQDCTDAYEYFRQVTRVTRLPNGIWDRVLPRVPIGRRRVAQLIQILKLPSHLLDLADLYNLSDTVLRNILAQPEEDWERLVNEAIREKLLIQEMDENLDQPTTGKEIIEEVENNTKKSVTRVPQQLLAARWVRRFHHLVTKLSIKDPYALGGIADEIVADGDPLEVIRTLNLFAEQIKIRLDGATFPEK
ncbi:MAG: hypothetical protein AB9888_13080 [Bacteroidales bacterium]